MGTAATWVRNVEPMHAANRARRDAVAVAKAIDVLVARGWQRSTTAHGLTLTEPAREDTVKTANG